MFYEKEIYTVKKIVEENEIGQIIEKYVKDKSIMVDIQPINAYAKANTWGNDVISQKEVYCDEILQVGDILLYKNKTYEIEKRIEWDDYNIYAIKGVDIVVN